MTTNNSMSQLRVSLNLDSAQFTQSLTDVNRRLRGVRSEFEANNDGTREYAQSLDGLRSKGEMLTRQMGLQQAKVDELRRRYEASKAATGETSAATENLARQYNNARGQMARTEASLQRVTDAIDDQTNKSKKAQKAMEDFGGKAQKIGGGLTAGVTAPILGIGAGFLKVADDAESSSNRIQRTLGYTKEQAEKVNKEVSNLWKDGFGDSKEDVETAILSVKQNFKNLDDGEINRVTRDSMYLAETFDADVNEVTRAGNNIMKGFGETSEKAFDLMAWGAQNGLNFSQEMFDNLAEYSPLYKDMGFSAEDYFQLLQKGTESGVYNLDYINDAMKEFQIRTKDGSDATADAMGSLNKSTQGVFKEFQNGKASVKDLHNAVIADLSSMDDKTKANEIGVGLYGTKWEDMEADTMFALGNIEGGLEGVDGAMMKSGDGVEYTFGEKAQMALRSFTESVIPIGERLLEVAERVLPKLEKGVGKMIGWWDNLTPKTQDLVLSLAGIAAVVGPLVAGLGFVAAGVAPLIPLITGAAGAIASFTGITAGAGAAAAGSAGLLGGFGGAMALLTGPVGLGIAAVALAGVAFYNLDKEMDKPIMKSKIFSDEISKSTQKAVGAYLDMDEDASEALKQMAWSQEAITDEMATSLVGKYDAMNNKILESMDKRHASEKEKQQNLFAESSALTAEEEARAMAALEETNSYRTRKQQEYNDTITAIITKAKDEKRALTEEEVAEIDGLQIKMKENAVRTMSKSEEEQVMILGRLKNQAGIITAEQAADVVKNSEKQRKETVKEANKQYEDTVREIEYMRDVTGTITAAQAQKMIDEAERAKKGTINRAEDMHNSVVASAQEQAGEHASQIDWETGKVLTGWDNMYNGILKGVNWVRDLFGMDAIKLKGSVMTSKKTEPAPSRRSKTLGGRQYANGTKHGKHPGGPALVGEEGPELAYMPNAGMTVVGQNGPEYLKNLPRGSAVLPAHHTANILDKYNFPAYANGVGDWGIFDLLTKGAKGAWNIVKDKFSLSNSVFPKKFNNMVGTDVLGSFGNMASGYISKLIDGFGGGDAKASFGNLRKTSSFGMRFHPIFKQWRLHAGDDYAGPMNTAIRSSSKGKVTRSGPSGTGFGTMVQVQDGMYSYIYAHLNKAIARLGSTVNKGSLLGLLGNTGDSTGPHLHYEVRKNGRPIKPNAYAKGGFINQEQMALVGEGGKQEVVIPLERYSARAKELWMQAGMKLGMLNPPEAQGTSGRIGNMAGVGTTVNNSFSYNISVAYTGSTSDADVGMLARKIKEEFERQDTMMSRSYGVT